MELLPDLMTDETCGVSVEPLQAESAEVAEKPFWSGLWKDLIG